MSLGNALTALNAGVRIRFGSELPRDYGTSLISPGSGTTIPLSNRDPRFFQEFSSLSLHIFAGVEGHAVARDITLDGNSFRDSHRVEKKSLVAELTAGAGVLFSRFKITYAHVYRTKSFEGQDSGQVFGSLNVSYSF